MDEDQLPSHCPFCRKNLGDPPLLPCHFPDEETEAHGGAGSCPRWPTDSLHIWGWNSSLLSQVMSIPTHMEQKVCPAELGETGGQGQLLSRVSVLYHGAHIFRQGTLVPSMALENQPCLFLASPSHPGSVDSCYPPGPQEIRPPIPAPGLQTPGLWTATLDINMVTYVTSLLSRVLGDPDEPPFPKCLFCAEDLTHMI